MRNVWYVTESDRIYPFENHLVNLQTEDTLLTALEPRRLFPVSNPGEYISLLNKEGHEVALIKNLDDLNPESKATIQQSLDIYYLVPCIQKLLTSKNKNGTLVWTVLTTHGEKTFEIRNRNHDIKAEASGKVRIRDSHDNRYVIENWHDLDNKSIRLLIAEI